MLVPTRTHGRVLIDAPGDGLPAPLLVGFHGYAENAAHMLEALQRLRADRRWILVSVQALHRFYSKGQSVVASWMTREDREQAIADNIDYVRAAVAKVRREHPTTDSIVYAGFSQGVAMAYRALAFAPQADAEPAIPNATGGILLAGDVPPDVVPHLAALPPLLIGRGTDDYWYTAEKAAQDAALFAAAAVSPELHVFPGKHEWDDSFLAVAGKFLDRLVLAAAGHEVETERSEWHATRSDVLA